MPPVSYIEYKKTATTMEMGTYSLTLSQFTPGSGLKIEPSDTLRVCFAVPVCQQRLFAPRPEAPRCLHLSPGQPGPCTGTLRYDQETDVSQLVLRWVGARQPRKQTTAGMAHSGQGDHTIEAIPGVFDLGQATVDLSCGMPDSGGGVNCRLGNRDGDVVLTLQLRWSMAPVLRRSLPAITGNSATTDTESKETLVKGWHRYACLPTSVLRENRPIFCETKQGDGEMYDISSLTNRFQSLAQAKTLTGEEARSLARYFNATLFLVLRQEASLRGVQGGAAAVLETDGSHEWLSLRLVALMLCFVRTGIGYVTDHELRKTESDTFTLRPCDQWNMNSDLPTSDCEDSAVKVSSQWSLLYLLYQHTQQTSDQETSVDWAKELSTYTWLGPLYASGVVGKIVNNYTPCFLALTLKKGVSIQARNAGWHCLCVLVPTAQLAVSLGLGDTRATKIKPHLLVLEGTNQFDVLWLPRPREVDTLLTEIKSSVRSVMHSLWQPLGIAHGTAIAGVYGNIGQIFVVQVDRPGQPHFPLSVLYKGRGCPFLSFLCGKTHRHCLPRVVEPYHAPVPLCSGSSLGLPMIIGALSFSKEDHDRTLANNNQTIPPSSFIMYAPAISQPSARRRLAMIKGREQHHHELPMIPIHLPDYDGVQCMVKTRII